MKTTNVKITSTPTTKTNKLGACSTSDTGKIERNEKNGIFMSPIKNDDMETIKMAGLEWAAENLKVGNKKHFTFDEAHELCPKGWRIPTREESDKLYDLCGFYFDENTEEGVWVDGKTGAGVELRLPADGSCNANGEFDSNSTDGCYWLATEYSEDKGYSMTFNDDSCVDSYNSHNKACKLSVRYVRDIEVSEKKDKSEKQLTVLYVICQNGVTIDNNNGEGYKTEEEAINRLNQLVTDNEENDYSVEEKYRLSELIADAQAECYDCDIFVLKNKRGRLHSDNIDWVDISPENILVDYGDFEYDKMNFYEYNNSILVNCCVGFSEMYPKGAKILVVTLERSALTPEQEENDVH